jgi:hypothetical protein
MKSVPILYCALSRRLIPGKPSEEYGNKSFFESACNPHRFPRDNPSPFMTVIGRD